MSTILLARTTSSARLGFAVAGISLVLSIDPVRAEDGELQRLLMKDGCVNADVKTRLEQNKIIAYEVNCFGTSHKVIDVVCISGRCAISRPLPDPDGEK